MPAAFTWTEVLERLRQATLGEYEIAGELGRGGMAAVYLAHDIALNRKVAIKVMSPGLLMGAGLLERFKLEAQVVARLTHPHIVTIHAIREAAGLSFIVMKYIEGCALESILRHTPPLSIPMVRSILAQVGSALAYAHRHGVVHRDVKPGNILIDIEGDAVVSDFGIAKVASTASTTNPGDTVGTPAYMSPEQCESEEITPASDQYSLGIVAFEMLTGTQPFQGSKLTVMRGHVDLPPPRITARRRDCPAELETVVNRMLAKSPRDRWPSIADALKAMGAVILPAHDPLRAQLGGLAAKNPATVRVDESWTPVSVPPGRSGGELKAKTPAPPRPPRTPSVLAGLSPRARVGVGAGAVVLLGLILVMVFGGGEKDAAKPQVPSPAPASVPSIELLPGGDLAAAVSQVADTGTIRLAAGDYRLDLPLILDRPFRLVGAGRDSTRILLGHADGITVGVGATPFELSAIEFQSSPDTSMALITVVATIGVASDLRIRGAGISGEDCGQAGIGVRIGGASALRMMRTEFTGLCTGIQITDSAHPELSGNSVTANRTGAMFLQQSGGALLRNRIWANRDGVMILGRSSPTLDQNEISNNRGYGVMGAPGSRARLLKNRINNNLGANIERP